jgi:heme oxygenase (mycobilin-producing)
MTNDERRARIFFLLRVPKDRIRDFLDAYERIRHVVANGVEGHLVDQVCQAADDPERWLITSEWRSLSHFEAWERTDEHRALVAPMRACIAEARSLRFLVRAETRGRTSRTAVLEPVPS